MNRSFFIAGVQFRPQQEIAKAMKEIKVDDFLILAMESDNKYDPNAVRIEYELEYEADSIFLGYVPKKFSAEVTGLLEAGVELDCIVEVVNPLAKPWEMCKVLIVDEKIQEESEGS